VVYFPLYEEVLEAEEIKVKRTKLGTDEKTKRIDRLIRSASHGYGLSVRLEAVYKYKEFMHGTEDTREKEKSTGTHERQTHTRARSANKHVRSSRRERQPCQ
jgi:hypothetical protein